MSDPACGERCGAEHDGACVPCAVHGLCHLCDHEELARERDRLRLLVHAACNFADEGWAYASDYMRDKWDAEKRLAALREAAGSMPCGHHSMEAGEVEGEHFLCFACYAESK